MTLEASVLGAHAVSATELGYEVALHLPWYRSLPLSCVEDIQITIAGETAARADIRVLRDGRALTLEEVAERIDDEWFVQDPLTFAVAAQAPLEKGREADVEVTLAVRVPYIIVGPGKALVKPTRVHRKVVIQ